MATEDIWYHVESDSQEGDRRSEDAAIAMAQQWSIDEEGVATVSYFDDIDRVYVAIFKNGEAQPV